MLDGATRSVSLFGVTTTTDADIRNHRSSPTDCGLERAAHGTLNLESNRILTHETQSPASLARAFRFFFLKRAPSLSSANLHRRSEAANIGFGVLVGAAVLIYLILIILIVRTVILTRKVRNHSKKKNPPTSDVARVLPRSGEISRWQSQKLADGSLCELDGRPISGIDHHRNVCELDGRPINELGHHTSSRELEPVILPVAMAIAIPKTSRE